MRSGERRRVRRGSVALVAAVAFALLGSGAAAQEGSPEATPPVTPIPDAPQITLEITELNDSGIEGDVVLYENGDQTIVEFKLENTGEDHPAHIHEGTCDDLQPQSTYDLENVDEEGTSISLVDAPLQDLIDGDYAIDLHFSPNELGLLLGCADIEGTPEVPDVGGGTPTAETATETPTEDATETPATETPATETPEPTEEPTPSPTPEPTPTTEPESTPEDTGDGTGGSEGAATSVVETPTPPTPTGGMTTTVSDGTQGGATQSGKGDPIDPTTGLPESTGSGSSLLFPDSPLGAAIWASGSFSVVLAGAALAIRRGEIQRAHVPARRRWGRLGL